MSTAAIRPDHARAHAPARRAPVRPALAAGFTLIEVLLSVLILALGLLGLGAVIPVVVRQQRQAADNTLGTVVASAAQEYLTTRDGFNISDPRPTVWDLLLNSSTTFGPIGDEQMFMEFSVGAPIAAVHTFQLGGRQRGTNHRVQMANGRYTFWNIPFGSGNSLTLPGTMVWTGDNFRRLERQPDGQWLTVYPPTGGSERVEIRLTAADRLWPSPQMRTAEELRPGVDPYRPQFIWDFVARRVAPPRPDDGSWRSQAGVAYPEQIQVAVFVRRVDLNIKLPPVPANVSLADAPKYTLYNVLTGNGPAPTSPTAAGTTTRVPIAVDAQGVPTNEGIDRRGSGPTQLRYSSIIDAAATFDPLDRGERDRLLISVPPRRPPGQGQPGVLSRAVLRLVAQPGQKLVDNLGNVYEVTGVPDPERDLGPDRIEVIVRPPVPDSVLRVQGGASQGATGFSSNLMRQVVFTPQVPAAVRVFTITRPVLSP